MKLLTWWRHKTRAERWFLAGGALVVALHAISIAIRRAGHLGDFDVSREFGRRFLAGEPLYAGGLHYPYMPAAAMWFAPLALAPPWIAFAARYAVALACTWLTFRMLAAMVAPRAIEKPALRITVAGLCLFLSSHYVLRDLDDGGPHLILLAILTGAFYCVRRGRSTPAALCFGLAAALKAPNVLLLPFLVWKRQWQLAALATAATIAWICLPAPWMGSGKWWEYQVTWTRTVLASAAGRPAAGARESEERRQNQSLRAVVARRLQPRDTATAGPEATASFLAPPLATVAPLALVGLFAAATYRHRRDAIGAGWLLEASAVLLLTLLLSPATWVQHLVLVIPALYLIVAEHCTVRRLGPTATAAMIAYAILALVLNRELLGRATYLVLLDHGLHTLCLLLLLGVLLLRRPAAHPHHAVGVRTTVMERQREARCT
jgi:alpha-1,2-mannosyltransferase